MNFTEKDKQLLKITGVAVPAVILLCIFLPEITLPGMGTAVGLKQVFKTFSSMDDEIAILQSEVDDRNKEKAGKDTYLANVAKLKSEVAMYESKLPSSERLDELMNDLNNDAQYAGQKYVSMKMLPAVAKFVKVSVPKKAGAVKGASGTAKFAKGAAARKALAKKQPPAGEADKAAGETPAPAKSGTVKSASGTASEPRVAILELPLQINLVTDYHGLGNFIAMTEGSERFSKIDDFTIIGDMEVPGRVNVQLTLSTFKFVSAEQQQDSGGSSGQGTGGQPAAGR